MLLSIIISCKDKIDNKSIGNKSEIKKEYSKIDVEGHTLFKITETDSGKILFKPCGANFEKYIMFGDSIFHHLGQEHFMFKITSKEILENQINYKLIYKYNLEVPDTADSLIKIIPLDKNQKYWKINNDIFIDSIFSNTIPIHKELPCDETCYDCPIIENKWIGIYKGSFLQFKEEYNDPRSWATVYINISKDSLIYELHSLREEKSKLELINKETNSLIFKMKNGNTLKISNINNRGKYILEGSQIVKLIAGKSSLDLTKEEN